MVHLEGADSGGAILIDALGRIDALVHLALQEGVRGRATEHTNERMGRLESGAWRGERRDISENENRDKRASDNIQIKMRENGQQVEIERRSKATARAQLNHDLGRPHATSNLTMRYKTSRQIITIVLDTNKCQRQRQGREDKERENGRGAAQVDDLSNRSSDAVSQP